MASSIQSKIKFIKALWCNLSEIIIFCDYIITKEWFGVIFYELILLNWSNMKLKAILLKSIGFDDKISIDKDDDKLKNINFWQWCKT